MPCRLVLASASPARLGLLRAAGFDPAVVVSGVDEAGVTGSPEDVAGTLAERKALAVTEHLRSGNHVVLGCDTVVARCGTVRSKPGSVAEARAWWAEAAGGPVEVVTGHAAIDGRDGRLAREVTSTRVELAVPDPAEIDAYLATGEPLAVAGALTIDGFGGPFVERIEGDHGTVVGLSLPALRRLLHGFGLRVTDFWRGVAPS